MASRYMPKERVLMHAAELLRGQFRADEGTELALHIIAARVEQLALVADSAARASAGGAGAAELELRERAEPAR